MDERREAYEITAAAGGRCPNCGGPRPDLSVPCPQCGSPALGPADPGRTPSAVAEPRRGVYDALMQVRSSDIEPYIGLRYLSKLFRLMAVLLILVLIAEVVTGLAAEEGGVAAIPTLLAEASRLVVLAGLLWGSGDLAILLVDIGHDVRAARILIGRQAAHHVLEHSDSATPGPDAGAGAGAGAGAEAGTGAGGKSPGRRPG